MTGEPEPLQRWVGRQESATDRVTPTPYAALSAMLDRDTTRPSDGTPLPELWHWLYFLPMHRQSNLGPDGHGRRGGFLPPVPLPRRMWAGGQLRFDRPLHVGDPITRTSTIESVEEKSGRAGALVFVRVKHEIRQAHEAEVAITEFQDIVYRAAPSPSETTSSPRQAPGTSAWTREWVPDDVLLFRYSALTFNGHRIHYDRRYVTEVEGYPGLVVHGPLIATLLVDLLRTQRPDARIAQFAFKAVRPLFDVHRFDVCGEPLANGSSVHLWARDHEGWLAMDATAEIA